MQLLGGADRTLPATKTLCDWKGNRAAQRWTLSPFNPFIFIVYSLIPIHTEPSTLSHLLVAHLSPPPLSPSLSHRGVRPLPPSIYDSLLFLSDAPLVANAERWQMDMTSRWFCLSSLITQIQSAVMRGLRLVKAAQSRDKFIQRTIDFDAEKLGGEKRLHLKWCGGTLRWALI